MAALVGHGDPHEEPKACRKAGSGTHSAFFDVTDPTFQSHLLQTMEDTGSEVVVIDNFTTCVDGLRNENDSIAFRPVMAFLMKMKQAGRVAILVHPNKSEQTFEPLQLWRQPSGEARSPPCGASLGRASSVPLFGKYRAQGNSNIQL
ncbi:hypothetical protein RLEG12_33010 [Rhizobium leguminosarum bv. trifolii CB782]|nr:hypothetical protein RLEG12_33010 [Rhizobium leguminosarum bv. trifolii CB782]